MKEFDKHRELGFRLYNQLASVMNDFCSVLYKNGIENKDVNLIALSSTTDLLSNILSQMTENENDLKTLLVKVYKTLDAATEIYFSQKEKKIKGEKVND